MPHDRVQRMLRAELSRFETEGRRKAPESIITAILPPRPGRGPRYLLDGEGDTPFLRMNANNYLSLSLRQELIAAEHEQVGRFGTGPGAVRFIGGTWAPHRALERSLATFHGREAAMIFSSAYGAMMGLLPQLITSDTAVISDELNHSCIINAIRLARPGTRSIYRHGNLAELETRLMDAAKASRRAIIVTDGIFSMRGDYAPLAQIEALARQYDSAFPENVLLVVDDSHGVGVLGPTGRGTEEQEGAIADILVGTLGKAFGVNGGYVAASGAIIDYLRETSPFYVYSNPITPSEAAAAAAAIAVVDGPVGRELQRHMREMAARFRAGLTALGLETIAGAHPIVPLLLRDTQRVAMLVRHLRQHGILATGLAFPVVPHGEEEIRFQICADHLAADIDETLAAIEGFAALG